MNGTDTKPNGPVAAAFLASGIGAFVLGLTVTIVEAFPPAKGQTSWFDFSKLYGLGSGVGPLSGKVAVAVIAYAIAWVVLHLLFRGREVPFGRVFTITLALVAIGFALTFPPIFDVFAPKA